MKKAPLIGVTGADLNHHLSWWFIAANLRLAGARMLCISPKHPHYNTPLDGLIVSGGRDIDPVLYGKQPKTNYFYDRERDTLEMTWINHALENRIPLLGICRGAQMLNVCLGGTLYMDIKLVCETAKYPNTVWSKVFARKPVAIREGSALHTLVGREAARVNSLHRQSLENIGKGLTVTAWEENRIVQAVEGEEYGNFLIGVQWHPEFMIHSRTQRRFFRRLVAEAALYRRMRESHSIV
jgi:putative glutamine amidotransferase